MKYFILLLLCPTLLMSQNEVLTGTSYSFKPQNEQSIGFHVLFNEDQYDAFAGYEAKVNIFETHTDILLGWELSSHDALRVYAGMSLGITLYNEKYIEEERYKDLFCYEFTGGIRYYSFLCPYLELSYGATFIRCGVDIDLVQTLKLFK